MQENEERDNLQLNQSVEDLFLQSQETYEEAQVRVSEENKTFAKTNYFRMEKLGKYNLRILPIAPRNDGTTDRRTYEYPVRQLIMELEKPGSGAKTQYLYVTAPRATDAGFSVDLIDTYRQLAVDKAKADKDEKLAEKIGGNSFGGGLKFNYGHAMYIYDMDERAKGPQLLNLTHAQFKELEDRKFSLWQKKLKKDATHPCPISSISKAYPVEIEKKKSGNKTEYSISIDNESNADALKVEELIALMNAPRIPEIVHRYSRYHFEATQIFLHQCDTKYGMKIMEHEEMIEAIDALRNELPKEDTSSFSFEKRSKDSKDKADDNTITCDVLFVRFDELNERGLGDKTEEGQELRAMIRTYIEQEKLPIRVNRTTTNEQLLDQIEEYMDSKYKSADTNTNESDSDPNDDLPF